MIDHNKPTLGDAEQAAAARVLTSGWVAQGREVEAFEREFCAFLGLPEGHAVALSSGSAALFISLLALGVKDKQVALPVYSCSSLTNAVALAGGRSQFMDVAKIGPNVDVDGIATSDADIVIAAHMFGIPIPLHSVRGKMILEDCAQALGALADGTPVGLQGTIGVYSFFATKLITTGGQGGMIVARDRGLIDVVRDYRQFDQRRDKQVRFNFQMTDLQAAIGRVQLSKFESFRLRRAQIYEQYRAAGIPLLDGQGAVRFRAVMPTDRAKHVIARLAQDGISAIVPVEDWELLDHPEIYPAALRLARSTVSIPAYPSLTDAEITTIIRSVRSVS